MNPNTNHNNGCHCLAGFIELVVKGLGVDASESLLNHSPEKIAQKALDISDRDKITLFYVYYSDISELEELSRKLERDGFINDPSTKER